MKLAIIFVLFVLLLAGCKDLEEAFSSDNIREEKVIPDAVVGTVDLGGKELLVGAEGLIHQLESCEVVEFEDWIPSGSLDSFDCDGTMVTKGKHTLCIEVAANKTEGTTFSTLTSNVRSISPLAKATRITFNESKNERRTIHKEVCVKQPKFNVTFESEKLQVDFSKFGCCKLVGDCAVCVSRLDGDCNNFPLPGQSLIKYCLEDDGTVLRSYQRNGGAEFTFSDKTFYIETKDLVTTQQVSK